MNGFKISMYGQHEINVISSKNITGMREMYNSVIEVMHVGCD
jgi:hypothetical protein